MMDKKIFVFDLDGTICDCSHRQHHVRLKPKRWDLFNKGIPLDTPHMDIIWLFQTFAAAGHTMLIASGRGAENMPETVKWLDDHGVKFHGIYMRKAKDSRPDNIVKGELLDQIRAEYGEPFMVFDDRNQVVDMWRAAGVRCLQVAPGEF